MKVKVLLESHNIKNLATGFGQFNYHLLNEISKINSNEFDFTALANSSNQLNHCNENISYKKYVPLHRYKPFRIREKFNIWHLLNQNTKILPYFSTTLVLTIHDVDFMNNKNTNDKKILFFKDLLNKASYVTYISEFAKNQTHDFFEVKCPEKVIYNGLSIQHDHLICYSKPMQQKPFLFSIGQFIPRKNFLSLVEMMKHINEYDLLIAGNCNSEYGEEVKAKIKEYKLENKVKLLGKVSEENKNRLYAECSAFVFPSLMEGFGLPILEASYFHKPIIATNQSSIPEILGGSGYYFSSFDEEIMAQEVLQSIENFTNDKKNMIKKQEENLTKFSWQKTASSFLDIYREIG